jgi:hypothetical protein
MIDQASGSCMLPSRLELGVTMHVGAGLPRLPRSRSLLAATRPPSSLIKQNTTKIVDLLQTVLNSMPSSDQSP